jgi:hypothetical protein
VARLYALSRTTVGRHKAHIALASRPLVAIRGDGGPSGPGGPLEEAFALAQQARTPRERLRGLEAVRAATKLATRNGGELDRETRDLLDSNVAQAERAYRDSPDFETRGRALAGWREAIAQRVDAAGPAEPIEVSIVLKWPDGTDVHAAWLSGEAATYLESPEAYWAGVPKRFRDLERFECRRRIQLTLPAQKAVPDIVSVYERSTGALMWTK